VEATAAGTDSVNAASVKDITIAKEVAAGISFVTNSSIMAGPSAMVMAAIAGKGFAGKNWVASTFNCCNEFDLYLGCFSTRCLAGRSVKQQTCL